MAYPAVPLPDNWVEHCRDKTIAQATRDFADMGYPICQSALASRLKKAGGTSKQNPARSIPRDYYKVMPKMTLQEASAKWGVCWRTVKDKCARDMVEYRRQR